MTGKKPINQNQTNQGGSMSTKISIGKDNNIQIEEIQPKKINPNEVKVNPSIIYSKAEIKKR